MFTTGMGNITRNKMIYARESIFKDYVKYEISVKYRNLEDARCMQHSQ